MERAEIDEDLELRTRIKLNVGFPDKALQDALLPSDGVGLARLEFILTSEVGVHPLALLHFHELKDWAEGGDLAPELESYRELGIDAFILSGYPHAAECDLFARHVLPRLAHGPLEL